MSLRLKGGCIWRLHQEKDKNPPRGKYVADPRLVAASCAMMAQLETK